MSENLLDIVWVTIAAILVFFMQAGFAFLESGLVRSKNSVNVLMKNYVDMCFGAVVFWMLGFGLMFGTNPTGWIGTDHFLIDDASNSTYTFLFFQMMFASTTATIMSGALAERIRYSAYIISAVVLTALIYPIFGSWAWGDMAGVSQGWLKKLGFIDFAGSTVVHSIGGWSALAGIIVLGPRLGRFSKVRRQAETQALPKRKARYIPGHNLPMMTLGGFILWFGFFGFNAGSALAADASIGKIVLNTHLAGCGGVIAAISTLFIRGKPILMGFVVNGGLGGLVSICASANLISPGFALLTGLIAGVVVVTSMQWLEGLGIDDAVGAVSAHGFAGFWGTLAVALFATGDLFNFPQLGIQFLGALTAFLWSFPIAWITFVTIDKIFILRVSSTDEQRGLDYAEHYEEGYPEFQQELLHPGKE